MEETTSPKPHARISPTAGLTAYYRSLSDVPFAAEIARESRARELSEGLSDMHSEIPPALSAVGLEIRYKAVNNAIRREGFDQVLELACGLSPRGLEIAAGGGRYLGTDLPGLGRSAFPVLRKIALREGISPQRLRYQAADALRPEDIRQATAFFHDRRFCVCMEGLLMYLSPEERRVLAENVREVLAPVRGSWITPDIAYHELALSAAGVGAAESLEASAGRRMEQVTRVTGRDLRANFFSGPGEAERFFEDLGFAVRSAPLYDGKAPLSTLELLDEGMRAATSRFLSAPRIWILTPRP